MLDHGLAFFPSCRNMLAAYHSQLSSIFTWSISTDQNIHSGHHERNSGMEGKKLYAFFIQIYIHIHTNQTFMRKRLCVLTLLYWSLVVVDFFLLFLSYICS